MNPHPRNVAILALVSIFSGCASYPMGMSKAQWNALPPETQARLTQEDAREARDGINQARDQMGRDAADRRKTDENAERVSR